MTEEQIIKATEILDYLISLHPSMRKFAHFINEDQGDISRCKSGCKNIGSRMTISICRKYPDISPNDLNPDIFPEDLKFVFKSKKGA